MQYMCRLSLIWFCLPGAWQPILYPVQLHSSINYPAVGVCPDCHRYGSECPGHASQWATLTTRLKTTHIRSSLPYRSQVSAWVAFLTFSHPWLCVCIGDHTSHTLTKLKTTLIQQCWSSVSPRYRMGHTFYTFYTVYTIQAFHKCFTFTLFAFSFCWFFIWFSVHKLKSNLSDKSSYKKHIDFEWKSFKCFLFCFNKGLS